MDALYACTFMPAALAHHKCPYFLFLVVSTSEKVLKGGLFLGVVGEVFLLEVGVLKSKFLCSGPGSALSGQYAGDTAGARTTVLIQILKNIYIYIYI